VRRKNMTLDLYRLFMPYLYHYKENNMFSSGHRTKGFLGFSVEHIYGLAKYGHYVWFDEIDNNGSTRGFDCREVFHTFKPSSRVCIVPKGFLWEADDLPKVMTLHREELYRRMLAFNEPVGFVDDYVLPLPDDRPVLYKHVVNDTVYLAALVVRVAYSPGAKGVVPKRHANLFVDAVEGILGLIYERGAGTMVEFRSTNPYKHYHSPFYAGKAWLDAEDLDDLMVTINRMVGHKFAVRTPEKFYTLLAMKAWEANHANA
jgi:hypothetical protein